MIGYYVHHHGRGHLHRATAIAAALGIPVTGLSSLPRPAEWTGDWIELPLDLDDRGPDAPDVTAGGRLHWVPLGVDGLRERMAAMSAWIAAARPDAVVADVSVEAALLARLHGVPVVSVALPGTRDDPAHVLGFDVSTAIIAAWPPAARGMVTGLSPDAAARLHPVGAISRFPAVAGGASRPAGGPVASGRGAVASADAGAASVGERRALVLTGAGGDGFTAEMVAAAREATPGWRIVHLGGSSGEWVADPRDALREADVVITHAGQNAIADVAAARRPAVIVPQPRPHDEQTATGRVLAAGDWPALVVDAMPAPGWGALLDEAAGLDGDAWRTWNDGGGAARAAAVIARVARGGGSGPSVGGSRSSSPGSSPGDPHPEAGP